MTVSLSELRRLATAAMADWSGPYTHDELMDTGEFTVGTAGLFAAVSPPTILALLDIAEAAGEVLIELRAALAGVVE